MGNEDIIKMYNIIWELERFGVYYKAAINSDILSTQYELSTNIRYDDTEISSYKNVEMLS